MDTLIVDTPPEITNNKWPSAKPTHSAASTDKHNFADPRDVAIAALMALAQRGSWFATGAASSSTPSNAVAFGTPRGGDADAPSAAAPSAAAPSAAATLKRHRLHQHEDDLQEASPLKRASPCCQQTALAPDAPLAAPAPLPAPAVVTQTPRDLFGGMKLTTGSRKETKLFRERDPPASAAQKGYMKKMADRWDSSADWEDIESSTPHVPTDATACTKPSKRKLQPQLPAIDAAIQTAIKRGGHCPLAAVAAFAAIYRRKKSVPDTLLKLLKHSRKEYGPKWCELPAAMYASRPPSGMFRCTLVRINGQLLEEPPTFFFTEKLRPVLSFVPLCTDNETSLPAGDGTFVLAHAPLSARRQLHPFHKSDCVIATAHATSFTVCIRTIGKHQVAVYEYKQAHYTKAEYFYPSKAVQDYVNDQPELAPFRTVHGIAA